MLYLPFDPTSHIVFSMHIDLSGGSYVKGIFFSKLSYSIKNFVPWNKILTALGSSVGINKSHQDSWFMQEYINLVILHIYIYY